MDISQLGEIGLIKKISSGAKLFSKDIIKGIGDDAAVIKFDKKHYLLLTTDTLVEDDHFSTKWFTPEQIGSKAIESNVSDIAAMGGFPKYALISLTLPKTANINFIDGLYNGINKKCKKYKINLIGGNLSNGKNIIINVILVGLVEKKSLCLRGNAKVNDLICVTGNLGSSRAGLELFRNAQKPTGKKYPVSGTNSVGKKKGKSISYYLNPKSRLGISKKLSKYAHAMEDVSDGLASEVLNICSESRVGAVIYKDLIPLDKNTIIDAKKVGKDPYGYALYGGEDYELVFTISQKNLKKLKGVKCIVVGEILQKNKGIYLYQKGIKKKLKYGYEHFKNN